MRSPLIPQWCNFGLASLQGAGVCCECESVYLDPRLWTQEFSGEEAAASAPWRRADAKMRSSKGLGTVSSREWSSSALMQHVGRTERVYSIIDTCWDMHSAPNMRESIASELFVDVSQNIDQGFFSSSHLKTSTTSQELYSFGRDRMLLAQEYLNILGMPPCNLDGLTSRQVRDLAGEAFALPVVTLLTTALILHAPSPDLWDSTL